MKQYTTREFKNILVANGYEYDRCKGDHATYKKDNSPPITFNMVRLKPIITNRLIKQYNLVVY